MSDFIANVKANLDTHDIPRQLKDLKDKIEKQKYVITVDTSGAKNLNPVMSAFNDLLKLQSRINSTRIKLSGLDSSKDKKQITELGAQLNELMADYHSLNATFSKGFSTNQIDALNRGFDIANKKIDAIKAHASDVSSFKHVEKQFNRLKDIAKQMGDIQVKIGKLDVDTNGNEILTLTSQFQNLENQYNRLRNSLKGQLSGTQVEQLRHDSEKLQNELDQVNAKVQDSQNKIAAKAQEVKTKLAESINLKISDGTFDSQISQMTQKFEQLANTGHSKLGIIKQDIESLKQAQNEMKNASTPEELTKAYDKFVQTLSRVKSNLSLVSAESKTFATSLQMATLDNKMSTWLHKNTRAAKDYGDAIESLREGLNSLRTSGKPVEMSDLIRIQTEFNNIQQKAIAAGKTGISLSDRFKRSFASLSSYVSASSIIYASIHALKEMYQNVTNIDSAMTELRKVTDETDESYDKFLSGTNAKAQEIGTTITGLITSTADFSRLGYNFEESQKLAETANIYAVVGDEIEDINEATNSIISTMKAFHIPANESLSIVDKFNEVGNKFAISSGGIGQALTRSASSLASANNTIDESIALITAANEIVQNPAKIGTAFKTISMRIRGVKTELEEAGLDTEGMAETTAKLREEVKALSGVDILLDENTFKSTYQIMDELSQKWGNLTDKQQAALTELFAGKHQGNVMASLMTNFDKAREVLQTSLASQGSAMKEHTKWLDSVEAKQLQLKASWEGLSKDFLSSKFVKSAVDGARKLINVIDEIVNAIGSLGVVLTGGGIFAIKKFTDIKLLSVISKLPPQIGLIAGAIVAVGAAAKATGVHLKKLRTGEYLKSDAKIIKEHSDNLIELNNLASEVENLKLIIDCPTSTKEEIANAEKRLQEIANLVNQKYNLNITANTNELQTALRILGKTERSEILTSVDKYNEHLNAADYQTSKSNLDKLKNDSEALSQYITDIENITDLYDIAKKITDKDQRNSELRKVDAKAAALYAELEEKGYKTTKYIPGDRDHAFSADAMHLSDEYRKNEKTINEYEKTIKNFETSSAKVADYLSQVLTSDTISQDRFGIDADIAKFKELGNTLFEAGVNTDYVSQKFAYAKQGVVDLKSAIESGKIDETIDSYIEFRTSIGESAEDVVRSAGMLRKGFTDVSQIPAESLIPLYNEIKKMGEENGVKDFAENAIQGASLLASGFTDAEQAVAAGSEGIIKVLQNAQKIYEQEGIFTADTTIDDKSKQLTELAKAIGLIPDNKSIKIDVDSGELSVITDITKEINETWGDNQTLNVKVITTSKDDIDEYDEKIKALDGKNCNIIFNADGSPARATIDEIEYDLKEYDASKGTATLYAEDKAIGTINLVKGEIDLIPKTKIISIGADFQGLAGFISTVDNLKGKGDMKFKFDIDGDMEILNNAGNLIYKLKNDDKIDFYINADGDLEVIDLITNKIQTIKKDGTLSVVVDSEVKDFDKIQGLTGKLAELNGKECKVRFSADNTPLSAKIGESKYLIDDYNQKTGIATLTADNGEAVAKINITTGEILRIPDKTSNIQANTSQADASISAVKSNINSVTGKDVKITATVDDSKVWSFKGLWDSISSKVVTLWTKITGTGEGEVDGTAVTGKVGVDGTAYSHGSWGAKTNGVALGGELGEELVVRDGKFFTIGSNSAEFFAHRKGDIIFNAEQTKQIFSKGRITHGRKRGRAFAEGDNNGKEPQIENFDWVETLLKRFDKKKDENAKQFKNASLSLASLFVALNTSLDNNKQGIALYNDAYNRYMAEANSVGLDSNWINLIQNGTLDISKVSDEALKKKINDYKTWYDKAIACKDAIDELNESTASLYKDNFDNVETAYDNILTAIEHKSKTINGYVDMAEEKGLLGSTKYYTALQKIEQENLRELEYEKTGLITALNAAVNDGSVEIYSDDWYKMQGKIDSVSESIDEAKLSLKEFDNEMRQITWDRFDYLHESIDELTKESDFFIELMEGDNLYEKNGKLSGTGMATLGLHGLNYETLMSKSASIAKEIENINKAIEGNPSDTNLINRRRELLELQRESILSAKGEKEAMISLVKEGIEKESDALRTLIDDYSQSLDSAKELYDYQNDINEQTKNIANLKKQLSAYENDVSEETQAKIQKLKNELKEAEEDIKDAQYEKYVSDQKELLENLYSSYEQISEERFNNIDVSFDELINKVNSNTSQIDQAISEEGKKVGITMSSAMNAVWNSESSALSGYFSNDGIILNGITGYFENANTSLSGANSALNIIKEDVNSIVKYASTYADANLDPSGTKQKMIQNSLDWWATDDEGRRSLNDDNRYYGHVLGYTQNNGVWYDSNGQKAYEITDEAKIRNIVSKMKKNSEAWGSASETERANLANANESLADRIRAITSSPVTRDASGVWWIGDKPLYSYKTGGLADFTGTAWLDGTPNKPELVLDAQDTHNFIALKDTLRNLAQQGISFANSQSGRDINSLLKLSGIADVSSLLAIAGSTKNKGDTKIEHIDITIPIEHVDDYNDFINQVQKDKQFEKFVRSVSVDLLNGGSTLSKNKYKW